MRAVRGLTHPEEHSKESPPKDGCCTYAGSCAVCTWPYKAHKSRALGNEGRGTETGQHALDDRFTVQQRESTQGQLLHAWRLQVTMRRTETSAGLGEDDPLKDGRQPYYAPRLTTVLEAREARPAEMKKTPSSQPSLSGCSARQPLSPLPPPTPRSRARASPTSVAP